MMKGDRELVSLANQAWARIIADHPNLSVTLDKHSACVQKELHEALRTAYAMGACDGLATLPDTRVGVDAMMTREEILALPAGDQLDELVAECVMGWRRRTGVVFSNESLWIPPGSEHWQWLPSYSSSMDAAWPVWERLVQEELTADDADEGGSSIWPHSFKGWTCRLWTPSGTFAESWAETAPLAICRTALLSLLPPRPSNTEARALQSLIVKE